jgi:hypothetical protein
MIALGLDGPEELAEAFYLAEQTAQALATESLPRGALWQDVEATARETKIAAARRLIALYRVEGMTMGFPPE